MANKNKGVGNLTQTMQNLSVQHSNGNNNNDNGQRRQPTTGSRAAVREANGNNERRSRRIQVVATRPEKYKVDKKGTSGTTVKLSANYFRMTPMKPDWTIYHYHVDFVPNIEETFIRKAILKQFRSEFAGYIFDGSSLFTSTKLKNDTKEILTTRTNGEKVKIVLKYVGNISAEDSLQVWNIILRTSFEALNLQVIRRNYFDFDPSVIQDIREYKLRLIPGYISSIRQHEFSPLMCAELTSKVLRTDTVLGLFLELSRNCRQGEDVKTKFSKEVIGMVVMTSYNQKMYRVCDVDWGTNPTSTFTKKDETVISYKDYYRTKMNIGIRDLKQPMLVSKPTEKQRRGGNDELIYLVPELCVPTGFTESMRKNFHLMKAVADRTRVGPADRVNRLLQMNQRILRTQGSQKVLKEWHVELDSKLVEFNGRELPTPALIFGGGKELMPNNGDWGQQMLKQKLYQNSKLTNWVVIVEKKLQRETDNFLQMLNGAIKTFGIVFGRPTMIYMDDERRNLAASLINAKNHDPQLIMVIVNTQNSPTYSMIKKFCVRQEGVLSQVVTKKVITKDKGLQSICTKIAIQMNCKLGAMPWSIKLPTAGMMFVGFDVCHDTVDKSKSFGALVATMDMTKSSNYFSVAVPHRDGTELSDKMAPNFQLALKAYQDENGRLPGHIIFFRDGVGDGQLKHVYDIEVQQLNQVIKRMCGEQHINFTFVVVCKRINTRIFKPARNGVENVKPGTVVDDVITLPERYDFFLVSQSVNQGTASPTSYNIIYDNSKILTPDRLQNLTYKMCHMYYNWSGTVRVPAVCQYAHKLSLLMGQFVHEPANLALSKKLYFL